MAATNSTCWMEVGAAEMAGLPDSQQLGKLTNTNEDYQLHLTTLLHINKLMKPILYKNCYVSPSERHPNTQVQ